VKVQV